MSKVDQFESVFRSALHDVFVSEQLNFNKIIIISDLDSAAHREFENSIKIFSNNIDIEHNAQWLSLNKNDYTSSQDLMNSIEQLKPELIFTYRNLHSSAWQYSHSLGEHLDVLIQKTLIPVVVVPHPQEKNSKFSSLKNTNVVMAITDHLSLDNDLVNNAAHFTQAQGRLYLMHIENATTFDYYMEVISKISTIDTDEAREKIALQLLKNPKDYIESVKTLLEQEKPNIDIKAIVGFGHHLTEYKKYINQHEVDLLVMNTSDKEQMAMHGLAYPLVVELRTIPLLLI
ncbi:hypothetical protein MNBD_GAMMA22-2623 [hydrothermal vent metagenome]|uniref:UspA domain-containing protein n=1 Tax=hydrothermal vent metagenome TaxID=652676 RepID=A0A3B1AEQ4_9ZZZZ